MDEKDVWKKKNEEAVEEEYQKELRVMVTTIWTAASYIFLLCIQEALVQSTIEAKNYEKVYITVDETWVTHVLWPVIQNNYYGILPPILSIAM